MVSKTGMRAGMYTSGAPNSLLALESLAHPGGPAVQLCGHLLCHSCLSQGRISLLRNSEHIFQTSC